MFDLSAILRRTEQLLGKPEGYILDRTSGLECDWPARELGNPVTFLDVTVSWDELPLIADVTALGKALFESHPDCRVLHSHADAGVICHQVGTCFQFGDSLPSLAVIQELPIAERVKVAQSRAMKRVGKVYKKLLEDSPSNSPTATASRSTQQPEREVRQVWCIDVRLDGPGRRESGYEFLYVATSDEESRIDIELARRAARSLMFTANVESILNVHKVGIPLDQTLPPLLRSVSVYDDVSGRVVLLGSLLV